jgi:threonyl-tRNA synthetase
MLVTGDREATEGTVSVRNRVAGDLGPRDVADFLRSALEERASRDLGMAHVPQMETARAAEA